jgi:hypothetical protein
MAGVENLLRILGNDGNVEEVVTLSSESTRVFVELLSRSVRVVAIVELAERRMESA